MPRERAADRAGLSKLVEKQMRNWELARSQRLAMPETTRDSVEDFICISRQVGAAGHEVAGLLASRLNWPLFDKELLDTMAGDDAIRRQVYESMDERDVHWFEEMLRSLLQSEFARNDYFRRLSETVLSIARQGSAIFLGRGVDRILPQDRGLRVRLVAPREYRIQRIAGLWRLPPEQAAVEIDRVEADRAEFLKRYFRAEVDDPSRHDLVVSLARFTPVQAVELILGARQVVQRSVGS
ncbi:MAG: cytidylate kinase-like family protein [Phycisphaerae bacterium]|nr:cytidylate kinase-like family protein [Phycisphaerae bacterium]